MTVSYWMNLADVVFALLLLFFSFRGWRRGLLKSLFGLFGFVTGAFLAVTYLDWGVNFILDFIVIPEKIAAALSLIGIFLVVLAAFRIAEALLHELIGFSSFGYIDSLGGAALGLLKGGFILSLLLLASSFVPLPAKFSTQLQNSRLANPIENVAPYLMTKVGKLFSSELISSFSESKKGKYLKPLFPSRPTTPEENDR